MVFAGRVLVAVALFAGLAALTAHALLLSPGAVLPGIGPGDNVAFLWNTWWFARAAAGPDDLFRTDLLFAPAGTQLSLHTHATLHSLIAWPWTSVSVPVAHNVAIVAGLVLNGVITFLLAHRFTGRIGPSLLAGWIFSASAFVQVHLLGHMNLLHAWVLPLYLLAFAAWMAQPTWRRAIAPGTVGAIVLHADYYFGVYVILLSIAWIGSHGLRIEQATRSKRLVMPGRALLALSGLALLLAMVIAATGGTVLDLGGIRISLRTARNPLAAAWLALLSALFCLRPIRLRRTPSAFRFHDLWTSALTAVLVAGLVAAPLLAALVRVVLADEYVAPATLWRSSPPGGDILTLALGHPLHAITGRWSWHAYERMGIDPIEQSLWIGLVPLVLVICWWRRMDRREAVPWLAIALGFGVVALGPFLRVGGVDTGLPLPDAVLRYVPVLSNARIPGRAIVVVQLAVAMLLAIAWARRRPRPLVGTALAVLIVLESLPGPVPVYRLPDPDAVDRWLAADAEPGGVIELPTGLRDGFGEEGAFDHRALVHQMVHGRPLAGGFVARLSQATRQHYAAEPFLAGLIAISDPHRAVPPPPVPSAAEARSRGFLFLVVNRDRLDESRLSRAELEAAGFILRTADGPRELFSASN